MPKSVAQGFLKECTSIPGWGRIQGRSHQWAYDMVEAGLPVLRLPTGGNLIHLPTAEKWLRDRMRSRGRKVEAA